MGLSFDKRPGGSSGLPIEAGAGRWRRGDPGGLERREGPGQRRRGELLIASGRLVLAAFSLLAVELPSSGGQRFGGPLAEALELYLVYAALLALVVWWRRALPNWLGVVTHGLDLVSFSLLSAWSLGPASPFFAFFVFGMVSATIRWRWRGTVWTAVAAMTIYGGLALYSLQVFGPERFALDVSAVRFVHLAVLALLLGYLGGHQHGLLAELVRVSDWPPVVSEDPKRLLEATLPRVAAAFKVKRVDLFWEEPDEPRVRLARWDEGTLGLRWLPPREEPSWQERTLAEGRDLLLLTRRRGVVALSAECGATPWSCAPVAAAAPDPAWTSALCLVLRGQSARGLLVAYDRPHAGLEDLVAGRVIAGRVAAQLDQLALLASLRQISADRERIRLARDLHDGLSQSLAGAALQLQAASRAIDTEPAGTRQRIEHVQEMLEEEQRELREFLHPSRGNGRSEMGTTCLPRVLEKTRAIWPLAIEAHGDLLLAPSLPSRWRGQICRLVQEALANAARHSGASRADLLVEHRPEALHIRVSDNGRGFPFEGSRDLDALEAADGGPRSLCDRVRSLDGRLTVASGADGATLDIHLPLPAEET